jgi:hypothetical protein
LIGCGSPAPSTVLFPSLTEKGNQRHEPEENPHPPAHPPPHHENRVAFWLMNLRFRLKQAS